MNTNQANSNLIEAIDHCTSSFTDGVKYIAADLSRSAEIVEWMTENYGMPTQIGHDGSVTGWILRDDNLDALIALGVPREVVSRR